MSRKRTRKTPVQLELLTHVDPEPAPVPPAVQATAPRRWPSGADAVAAAKLARPSSGKVAAAKLARPSSGKVAAAKLARPLYDGVDFHKIVERISNSVLEAWRGHHGSGRDEVPVGVVGALSLIRQADPEGTDLRGEILDMSPAEFLDLLREIWGRLWIQAPYLAECARPMHDWLEETVHSQTSKGALAVAQRAIRGGLFTLTSDPDPWYRAAHDVLGRLLMDLRTMKARQGRGEFHTPLALADAMARLLLDPDIEPGAWLHEPAAGSGTMFRAAAQAMRERGQNPANYQWFAVEIDPLASATCVVNSVMWGLGPSVLVHCGNGLDLEALPKAQAKYKAVMDHHRELETDAAILAALIRVEHLVRLVSA